MSSFIDYAELKTRVSITDAVSKLGLELHSAGKQLRGFCPKCMSGGDRALVITPERSLFYCFAAKTGGDQLALVAHLQGLTTNEAANWLAGTVPASAGYKTKQSGTAPPAPASSPLTAPGFDPAAYTERLDVSHASLGSINVSPDTLKASKAGYAGTGKLRGRLALPLNDRQGKTLCYVGRLLNGQQPQYVFGSDTFNPKSVLFGWDKVPAGDVMYVARDPIDVLKAYEGGICAVSFVGDITADSLTVLSHCMDELQVPSVEFI